MIETLQNQEIAKAVKIAIHNNMMIYMKNRLVLIIIFFSIGCNNATIEENGETHQPPNVENIFPTKDAKPDNQPKQLPIQVSQSADSNKVQLPLALAELLEKQEILSQDLFKRIFFFKEYPLKSESVVSLIKLHGDMSSGELSDPVVNFIIHQKEEKLHFSRIIGSVDEGDFSFFRNQEAALIFNYYSSPVGYTEFYILDKENDRWYLSQRFDEMERLDLTSIDFKNKVVKSEAGKDFELKLLN